eukprot:scaffold50660_cov69-Cyclotella_meneghiniana.AAC.3
MVSLKRHSAAHTSCSFKNVLLCLVSYIFGYFNGRLNFDGAVLKDNIAHSSCEDVNTQTMNKMKENHDKGLILPLEHTELKKYLEFQPPAETESNGLHTTYSEESLNKMTDTYTYFHNYLNKFAAQQPLSPKDFKTLPLLYIWPIYFEAYHNHWQRYRGKEVVFMEIGVQSGGKIPMLRDYFGPGFTYIGVDINPSTKKFESADWIHIEIGSSEDIDFLTMLKKKYPKVDLFLDDGGHTMNQQRTAMKEMLPHVQPDGVYMIEDLCTSWASAWQGYSMKDSRDSKFLEETTVGLVHRSMDWLQAGWIRGLVMKEDTNVMKNFWPNENWWLEFHKTVKHIHYYNMLVVYEKGYKEPAFTLKTIGTELPWEDSGEHEKVDWGPILERVSNYTKSEW